MGLALAIVAPLIATTVLGAFNGTLVTVVGLQPIIATLVLYLGGRGIAQLLVNGELRELRNLGSPLISSFEFIGLGQVFGIRFQIIIMLVVVVVAMWVLRATTFGRYVLATGGNPAAARLAGVPVNQVKMAVYCISGFLAGLAGLVVVAINRSSDPHRVGEYMELDAIAAVAVGGTPLIGWAGHDPGHLHRRDDHPALALYPHRAQHPGRHYQNGDRGSDRGGGAGAAAAVVVSGPHPLTPSPSRTGRGGRASRT